MKKCFKYLACFGSLVLFCACAHRYYLGMHGPSIQAYPDIHQSVSKDSDCLGCHHPDAASGAPVTSHPKFVGCLKCHNDSVG